MKDMRWKNAFIPTLREEPKEAEVKNHKLLLRGGYIKSSSSGVYSFLPLGWKVMKKIMDIVREEMDRIGGQEMHLPALTPKELWEETGRWVDYGDDMYRLQDRKEHEFALAPTHEEVMAEIARSYIKSWRDLPQIWYQIQLKYRDEPRPRGGVLRGKTFFMKDAYSFDKDFDGLSKNYEKHYDAYTRIFERCGLNTTVVSASSGIMGGSESNEFMVIADIGEDTVVKCPNCNYAANSEVAETLPVPVEYSDTKLEKVHTPVEGNIEEISKFFGVDKHYLMKSLLYIVKDKPVFILVRGDYDIDERKLEMVFPAIRPAHSEEVQKYTGAMPGYVSPIGLDIPTYADISLKNARGMISGANQDYYHYTGIDIERDINFENFIDVRRVKDGDRCKRCGSPVEVKNAIELGHIFKLGTKYSEAMSVLFTDKDGKQKPIVMGSYGIGIERIMASVIETNSDDNGIVWNPSITPYEVLITNLDAKDKETTKLSESIYKEFKTNNIDALYDDRDETPGVKFKDADLIGIPLRITVGKKGLQNGTVEIKIRKTGEKTDIKKDEILDKTLEILKNG